MSNWEDAARKNENIKKWYSNLPESRLGMDVVDFMKSQKERGIYDYQKAIESGYTPEFQSEHQQYRWNDAGKGLNNPNLFNQDSPGFNRILINTLRNEGGLVTDSGGLTNHGIRQDLYNIYAKKNNLQTKSVKDLKYGEARRYYGSEYFAKPKINLLPNRVSWVVFDTGVNLGQTTAIKQLQSVVGTKPDGKIGKKTIAAVNDYISKNGEESLIKETLNSRANYYSKLAQENPQKYGEYYQGWMNRIEKIKQQYQVQ